MIPLDPATIANDSPFYGARVKVAMAHTHLAKINEAVAEYQTSNPYSATNTFNPDDNSHTVTLAMRTPPVTIGLVFGDGVHNLRAALDILAVELTRIGLQREGKEMSRTKLDKAGFLICANREGFESKFAEATQHWSDAAKDYFRNLEPFKDGGHDLSRLLWNIHKLDILDKHKVLLTLGTTSSDATVDFSVLGIPESGPETAFPQMRLGKLFEDGGQLSTGDEIVTYWSDGAHIQIKFRTAFAVAIEEPEIIERTSAIDALAAMLKATDTVVEDLAARA